MSEASNFKGYARFPRLGMRLRRQGRDRTPSMKHRWWAPWLYWRNLAATVRALEDERGILKTLYQYGHAIDYGDHEEWVDCFTEDAVYNVCRGEQTGRASDSFCCEGRAELAAFVSRRSRPPKAWYKHLLFEPLITIEGRCATAVSYFAIFDHASSGPYLRGFGRYRDRLVYCSDGEWRFKERTAEFESSRSRPDTSVAGE